MLKTSYSVYLYFALTFPDPIRDLAAFLCSTAIMSSSSNSSSKSCPLPLSGLPFLPTVLYYLSLPETYLLIMKVPSKEVTRSKSTAFPLITFSILKEKERAFSSEIYKFPKGVVRPWFSRKRKTCSSLVSIRVKVVVVIASLGRRALFKLVKPDLKVDE